MGEEIRSNFVKLKFRANWGVSRKCLRSILMMCEVSCNNFERLQKGILAALISFILSLFSNHAHGWNARFFFPLNSIEKKTQFRWVILHQYFNFSYIAGSVQQNHYKNTEFCRNLNCFWTIVLIPRCFYLEIYNHSTCAQNDDFLPLNSK